MARKPAIPQTDAAADIAAMAAKLKRPHLKEFNKSRGRTASGTPASGIPAGGEGWGGDAKGASPHRESDPADLIPGTHEPSTASLMRTMNKAQRSELLEAVLFDRALASDVDATKVNAAAKLHAIYNGQPTAMVINGDMSDVDRLSDAEFRLEIQRLLKLADVAREETGEGSLPGKPAGVVH